MRTISQVILQLQHDPYKAIILFTTINYQYVDSVTAHTYEFVPYQVYSATVRQYTTDRWCVDTFVLILPTDFNAYEQVVKYGIISYIVWLLLRLVFTLILQQVFDDNSAVERV